MRNLKKILALVLALVMSLSLMATAGAAETTAADSTDPYAVAKAVLTGVNVFKGNPNGDMTWNDPITRVQAAALVYRIATGDVEDAKAALHTNNPFNDVPVTYWGNSYISYGYNAGILKGYSEHTFNPDHQVTGYQVLAMILRAMGYGRNGEFEGTGWEVRTASKAQELGLLKNVTPSDTTTLGQPANRGMVAEILLRAILTNNVMYSALNPYNYTELDTKLADNLGLEEETGVIVANEWADLDNTAPIAANKVRVVVSDGTTRTLDWSAGDKQTGGDYDTGVKDIGKARDIYIQNKTKVLYLAESSLNDVKDNEGAAKKVSALKDNLTVNDTTLHFTNFTPTDKITNDMRIEICLELARSAFGTTREKFQVSQRVVEATLKPVTASKADRLAYELVIPANEVLTGNQISIMKEIFRVADDTNDTNYIKGEVYVGTQSANEANDVSNSMSYEKFDEKYLKHDKATVTEVGNGDWLQVVDNDGDGVAEYVFEVNYELDTIVESRGDKFYYRGLNVESITPAPIREYTQAVGDVVIYAVIDGKAYVHKADTASATFKAVDYKNEKATDTEDKVWEQSAIVNHTTLPQVLVDVDELTSYNMYLDEYGYVRAYDNNVSFALLTEVYPTSRQNQAWVVDRNLTVEAMPVGATAVKEYNILNSYYNNRYNPFFAGQNNYWTYPGITNNRWDSMDTIWYGSANWLQPATHMLGTAGEILANGDNYVFDYTDFDRYFDRGNPVEGWTEEDGWTNLNRNSWTNVAKYTQTAEGLNLYTAAGTSNNVTTDYIRLDANKAYWGNEINKTDGLFPIADEYYDEYYTSADSHYVRAVDNTVFFLVSVDGNGARGIRQYTGYKNLPTINWMDQVRSMYAVAHTTANKDENVDANRYWVGDVIVIEMYDYNPYESIALIYSNGYKSQGEVKYLDAIDSLKGEITIIPNNYKVWNGQFGNAYGFYGLNNIVAVEGQEKTYTADITYIGNDPSTVDKPGWLGTNTYNRSGIYYGQVRNIYSTDTYSDYIVLDVLDHIGENGNVVDTRRVHVNLGAWAITDKTSYNTATPLVFKSTTTNNKVQVGDKVFWVETSDRGDLRTAGFLIDLTDRDYDNYGIVTKRSWADTPSVLWNVAADMRIAQWNDTNFTSFWNYEEIIGKRNDLSNTKSLERAPQAGFVVSSYELFDEDGNSIPSVYSGVMEDGLWHIRYDLRDYAGQAIQVVVDRNTAKDLVLNSDTTKTTVVSTKFYDDDTVRVTGTGTDVFDSEVWYFTMPDTLTANQKVVGTIFADTTKIPADMIWGYGVSNANRYVLNEERDNLGTTEPVVDDAAKVSAAKAAIEALKLAVDNAEGLTNDTIKAAVKAQIIAAAEAKGVTVPESDITVNINVPAVDGTEENPTGTKGIFSVTVALALNGKTDNVVVTGTINAKAYTKTDTSFDVPTGGGVTAETPTTVTDPETGVETKTTPITVESVTSDDPTKPTSMDLTKKDVTTPAAGEDGEDITETTLTAAFPAANANNAAAAAAAAAKEDSAKLASNSDNEQLAQFVADKKEEGDLEENHDLVTVAQFTATGKEGQAPVIELGDDYPDGSYVVATSSTGETVVGEPKQTLSAGSATVTWTITVLMKVTVTTVDDVVTNVEPAATVSAAMDFTVKFEEKAAEPTDPLATEKAAAKTAVTEYKASEIAALDADTDADAIAAIEAAKTAANTAIDEAATETAITEAVNTYKAAVDEALTPEKVTAADWKEDIIAAMDSDEAAQFPASMLCAFSEDVSFEIDAENHKVTVTGTIAVVDQLGKNDLNHDVASGTALDSATIDGLEEDGLNKYKAVCHWWYQVGDLAADRGWALNPWTHMTTIAGGDSLADNDKIAFIAVPCGVAEDGTVENVLLIAMKNQGREVKHTFNEVEWTVDASAVTFAAAVAE